MRLIIWVSLNVPNVTRLSTIHSLPSPTDDRTPFVSCKPLFLYLKYVSAPHYPITCP